MTDLEDAQTEAIRSSVRKRNLRYLGAAGIVAVGVLVFLGWYFLIRDTAPATVDSSEAAEAREAALEEAAADDAAAGADAEEAVEPDAGDSPDSADTAEPDEPDAADSAGADTTAGADDTASTGDAVDTGEAADTGEAGDTAALDGSWTVDTTIGTFDDSCLTDVCDATFVGFRIDEELANIGAKTVVGRTPGVTGSMTIAGTTITAAEMTVDMTQLITDSSSRTNALRGQAIETEAFPEASFVLTQPIELGAIPAAGEQVVVDAVGDLTIHGVTRTETIPLTAEVVGEVIVVFGQLGPILLADYEIDEPRAAVVLSVEDNAIMELQLFFTR